MGRTTQNRAVDPFGLQMVQEVSEQTIGQSPHLSFRRLALPPIDRWIHVWRERMLRYLLFLTLALPMVWFSGIHAQAALVCDKEACCQELNAFWQATTYHGERSVNPKDFLLLDGDRPWQETFQCPSAQSYFADGLKLLHDFSQTDAASINYYDWVRETMDGTDPKTGFVKLYSHGYFTRHNRLFSAIEFSLYNGLPTLALASTIVHEALHVPHSEGENPYNHVPCDDGPWEGYEGFVECDEKLGTEPAFQAGAYSLQMRFLHEYRQGNATPENKEMAKIWMELLFDNAFNTVPEFGPDGVMPIRKYYDID
ncbi:MAG: hypothetical protein P1V21_10360 [Rhizobiaceae bacterium]|nr:hypothetical protein [Rhizobiaceae bacterium]